MALEGIWDADDAGLADVGMGEDGLLDRSYFVLWLHLFKVSEPEGEIGVNCTYRY
jgi:hypothetical protein